MRIACKVLIGERAHLILINNPIEFIVKHLEHLIDRGELSRRTHRVVTQQIAHGLRQLGEISLLHARTRARLRAHILDRAERLEAQL